MTDEFERVDASPAVSRDVVTGDTAELLARTRPWVQWVAIWGFITIGLLGLGGLLGGIGGAMSGSVEMAALMIIYPLMALLYLFPTIHLYRYSKGINAFLQDRSEAKLAAALESQRAFWKFVGILLIVSIVLMCAFFFVMVVGGAMGMGAIA